MIKFHAVFMNPAEVQSQLSRVKNAEGLIRQLPQDHDGRNTWLLNYGTSNEAKELRKKHGIGWSEFYLAALSPSVPKDATKTTEGKST